MPRKGTKNDREKKRRREDDEEEEEDDYRRVKQFLDLDAQEADSDEDEDSGDDNADGFFVDGPDEEEHPDDYEVGEIGRRSPLLGRRVEDEDEEEEDIEAMERMIENRYSRFATNDYGEDPHDDEISMVEQQSLLPSVRDPKLWLVKCLPGHEKEVAASLMQKSVDKRFKLGILSAIALDNLQNYTYVEAYKEAHVKEACKGMRHIFSKNITMVPVEEMSNVLTVKSKRIVDVAIGDWVRLKRSNYKGSLARVVKIDYVGLRVKVEVAPKMSSLSLEDRQDGRIRSFYKTVALSSVATGDINPSIEEVKNFQEFGVDDRELATLFKGLHHDECWTRGEAVVVAKGELKNLKGTVEYVDGDLVHIKPNVKIPMNTVTVRSSDLVKHFEPGSYVKVVHGVHEGATCMVIKVNQKELIILSDASKEQITVLASKVLMSEDTSESMSTIDSKQERSHNSEASGQIPHPASANRPPLGNRPFSAGRGAGHFSKRQDSMTGKTVKITQGPYRGYRGCIKGVSGRSIRIELEAQMKVVTVDRTHISDNISVPSTNWNMQRDRPGSETPLPPRTPMHSMGGETPWRTPFRTPSRPPTPVHRGPATPICEQWNQFTFTSPTRLVPTP